MPARYEGFDTMPIAGTWRPGTAGLAAADHDPYTGEVLTEIPLAGRDDLEEAYASAVEAGRRWAARTPEERRDEAVDWIIRESGSVTAVAELGVELTLGDFYEAASYPFRMSGRILDSLVLGKENRVYRKPVGVVTTVISPWNVPLHLTNRSEAPALALGNAAVVKPAGDTPVTGGLFLARLLEEAGLPPGVLSALVGPGSETGDALVEHPIPRVISFTGSTVVGEGIARKAGQKKLALELGGNGPLVVLDDADLGLAVDAAVFGRFFHAGQICMVTNRIVVDAAVHEEFVGH